MIKNLKNRYIINDIEEVSLLKAILFLSIVPITIITLNEDYFSIRYIDVLMDYTVIVLFSLLIGKDRLLLSPNGTIKETIRRSVWVFAGSVVLMLLGLYIVGTDNPQGLDGVTYNDKEFMQLLSLLPFIGFGEEFICLLAFLGIYSLLPFGKSSRFIISLLLTALIFGFLHSFYSPLTAVLPLSLGHIVPIFAMFYYRSIIPTVLVHIFWDFFNFFMHYNYVLSQIVLITIISAGLLYHMFKKRP